MSGVCDVISKDLHEATGGDAVNPLLRPRSRAPRGPCNMLTPFFHKHRIPVGPEMSSRERGRSWRHPWPRRATDHERELTSHMMKLHPDLPFAPIGDSGRHDPEAYARMVQKNPGRVKAVDIRDVSRQFARMSEGATLMDETAAAASSLVLAPNSVAVARHAAGSGIVPPEAVCAVTEERDGVPTDPSADAPRSNAWATGPRSAS